MTVDVKNYFLKLAKEKGIPKTQALAFMPEIDDLIRLVDEEDNKILKDIHNLDAKGLEAKYGIKPNECNIEECTKTLQKLSINKAFERLSEIHQDNQHLYL